MISRTSWDEGFMARCLIGCLRSTCVKRNVAAELVKENRSIASGYNGAPKKVDHCTRESCTRVNKRSLEESKSCRGTHAEINCLVQASLYGVSVRDSRIYVTRFPCMSCTKAIINAEIREIIYLEESDMDNEYKMRMLEQAGVSIRRIEVTPFLQHVLNLVTSLGVKL